VLQRERALDLGCVAPELFARGRVERDHRLVRRAEEQPLADLERRDFEGRLFRVPGLAAHVAGAKVPGLFELPDVGRRDLVERRVALPEAGAAVSGPVVLRRWRAGGRGGRCIGRPIGRRRDAFDAAGLARPREHRGNQEGREHHAENGARSSDARGVPPCQRTRHPGREQEQAEHEEHIAARGQRPPVEAHLPQRPDQREQHDRRIDQQPDAATALEQQGRRDEPEACDEVVPRAAECNEPRARDSERQARKADDHGRRDEQCGRRRGLGGLGERGGGTRHGLDSLGRSPHRRPSIAPRA
jgi:hypothetical protein